MSTTTIEKTIITVRAAINAPVEKVWNLWTNPKHIIHWNNASDDWHTPKAENDLRVGGRFLSRMEAKDGSAGFDFTGQYIRVEHHKLIEYIIADGRKVQVTFVSNGNETSVKETFEAEQMHTIEMQQSGWQSILDNFKKYVEASGKRETLHFEIIIYASAEKVYKTMIDDKKWKEWTAEFNASSRFEGSWEKGSRILFLGTDKDGSIGGMASKIKENIPNKFISIEHQGIIQNGKEITSGSDVNEWAGALENYTFTENNGKTTLSIDMESKQEAIQKFKPYFLETWPKALKKLKSMCEK